MKPIISARGGSAPVSLRKDHRCGTTRLVVPHKNLSCTNFFYQKREFCLKGNSGHSQGTNNDDLLRDLEKLIKEKKALKNNRNQECNLEVENVPIHTRHSISKQNSTEYVKSAKFLNHKNYLRVNALKITICQPFTSLVRNHKKIKPQNAQNSMKYSKPYTKLHLHKIPVFRRKIHEDMDANITPWSTHD